uniref:Uncharacterized protein n=1 Tax=Triticum urartu TaxID=4572 RepID=A0A8R7QXR2_TRIUA
MKSLISLPCFVSDASIPSSVREEHELTDDVVQISIGIEDIDDLIADLDYTRSVRSRVEHTTSGLWRSGFRLSSCRCDMYWRF